MQVSNAPISWKKAQSQACVTWCGWDVNFDFDTIQLTKGKIRKLQEQIAELLRQPKACRKLLERTIGLLVWATSISLHLRPHLAPLYSDLNSPPGSQCAITAPVWQTFRSSLTENLQLPTCPVGLYIPPGSRILKYRGRRLHCKPKVPASAKTQFIRASDPDATHTRLRRESTESLRWLAQTLAQAPRSVSADGS